MLVVGGTTLPRLCAFGLHVILSLFNVTGILHEVAGEILRAQRLRCFVCSRGGAVTGCAVTKCRRCVLRIRLVMFGVVSSSSSSLSS